MSLIYDKIMEIKWHPNNYKHFINKGYNFTKFGDVFLCKTIDLKENSCIKVEVICDYCGKHYFTQFRKIYKNLSSDNEIDRKCVCCKKCLAKKLSELSMQKYGVSYTSKLDSTKQKYIETCNKKYGCNNTFQVEEFKEKSKLTCIEKYNAKYYNQTEEHKERVRNTSLKKYGVDHFTKSDIIKDKCRKTCIKKYGVDYLMKDKEYSKKIQLKRIKTMYENNNAPCSSQQKYIYNLLNNNNIKCELNYPFLNCWLDIYIKNTPIYIEYDGSGHDLSVRLNACSELEFKKHEIDRQYFLNKNNFKLIRIKSKKDMLPDDKLLLFTINRCIEYLINTDHSWITIDIDNNILKSSCFIENILFI